MTRRILMLVGDRDEEYEIMVPFQALQMVGYQVHAICPGKCAGEVIRTSIYDSPAARTDDRPGHQFALNASFDQIKVERYDALVIPGGGAPNFLRLNSQVLDVVRSFAKAHKPIGAIGSGPEILAAAGVIRGGRLSADPAVAAELEAAGAECLKIPEDEAWVDGNIVTAAGWHAHPDWLAKFLKLMHADISVEELPLVTA